MYPYLCILSYFCVSGILCYYTIGIIYSITQIHVGIPVLLVLGYSDTWEHVHGLRTYVMGKACTHTYTRGTGVGIRVSYDTGVGTRILLCRGVNVLFHYL